MAGCFLVMWWRGRREDLLSSSIRTSIGPVLRLVLRAVLLWSFWVQDEIHIHFQSILGCGPSDEVLEG